MAAAIGTGCNNLGNVLRDQGDVAGARTQFERALQIGEAALGPDHPRVTTIRRNFDTIVAVLRHDEDAHLTPAAPSIPRHDEDA